MSMFPIFPYPRTKRRFYKLDSVIRVGFDRILPRNMTVRYVAALSAVGVLAVLGHVIIQFSLAKQTQDQRKIGFLQEQIYDSESLRKIGIALQLTTKKVEIKRQIEMMQPICEQLGKIGSVLASSSAKKELDFAVPSTFMPTLDQTQVALTTLVTQCRSLLTLLNTHQLAILSGPESPLDTLSSDLLSSEKEYQSGLRSLSLYYEKSLVAQIAHFKNIEIALLLTTLILLVLEALYVFRPGVERLYFALQTHSDFLGHMGHEIRNPMNSIIGMTNLLLETPMTPQQKKYLSILKKSSGGLLEMLNNLLDFSSIAAGSNKFEKIPFNLYELLERSIDLAVFGAHASGIELILNLGTDVPVKLIGDPVRLQQVLSNLLGNAVKFTKHGEVTLQVQLLRKAEDCLLYFAIIDTGIGIEKGKTEKIFNAFVQEDSTVRRRFGGSGLGLSISRELVKIMGGSLAVESQKNVGSKFYFSLPFNLTHQTTAGTSLVSIDQIISGENFGPYEAVIVEPNDRIATLIEDLIKKTGGTSVRLKEQKNLVEFFSKRALTIAKKEALIIDFEYAKNTLNRLFSRYRREKLEMSHFVFLIKTTASAEDIEKLAEFGIKNFLFKPVKPIPLIDSIRQACTGISIDSRKEPERTQAAQVDLGYDERRLRILVVDDSKDNQFLIKAYLGSTRYRLVFADNGKIAVDKFKEARFDIVLMDLQMPEMDGYTASSIIREWETLEFLPPTPILAVSAHDHEYQSERFINAKFAAYLVKPISPYDLRKAILDHTQHISPPKLDNPALAHKPQTTQSIIDKLESELAELVPEYLKNRKAELGELRKFVENSDYKKIETIGHRLKGNAKSYGFEDLGKLGSLLETASKNKDLSQAVTIIGDMEKLLDQVSRKNPNKVV